MFYLSNKCDANSGVGTNEFDENLCADVTQQLLNMFPNEGVLHDGPPTWSGREGDKRRETEMTLCLYHILYLALCNLLLRHFIGEIVYHGMMDVTPATEYRGV